jgi:glutamate formiminotransferase
LDHPIIECVPNFSEGRNATTVTRIAEAIASVAGVAILSQTSDRDHNRSVFTFAGAPDAVSEAAFRAIECAVALIDMNSHAGVHPRIGAADVVPLVPVSSVSLEFCAQLAAQLGERVWRDLQVPVYLYEAAARRPDRANLANIRRGRFENLREQVRHNADRLPDFGEPALHPTAGACVIGARRFLIAFNINLTTSDVQIAGRIARKIRASSGGLPEVKALGLYLESRGQAQVSTNLINFEVTPLCAIVEAVRAEAQRCGVGVESTELIGLIPRRALDTAGDCELHITAEQVLENRLDSLLR